MTVPATLSAHIRQLVDKKNYVIAIKTHAQEQGFSLDEAKAQIDAYEQMQLQQQTPVNTASQPASKGFEQLTQGLDNRIAKENITMPLVPYWVKRVTVILLVLAIIGLLLYRLFAN